MKTRDIVLWIISGLCGLAFVASGTFKFMDSAAARESFAAFGFATGLVPLIAACEMAGGVGLLIPRVAGLAASGLVIIMLGAVYAHVSSGEGTPVPPAVLGTLCAYLVYARGLPFGSGGSAGPADPTDG